MADFFDSLFKDAKAKELEAKFKSIGLLTIEHKPVDLDTFIFSKDYLGLEMLSPKQARLLIELDNLDPETCKNEFVVVVGKGGGKDLVASIASLRFCYRLAIEGPPADYTGKHLNLPITSLNIAVNAEQANSVYFETFKNIGKNIFKKLDCEVKMGEVVFPNNITAVSGHSFAEGLEGYNLFSATLDEIAAFKTESELKGKSIRSKQSAKFIYDMAKSSIKSRFPKTGKLILISYPRFEGDFILQKYQEGLSNPKVYTEFATTWEFNPYAKEEDFDSEKERDFKEYCSKYLCLPPKAKDAYFSEEDRVRAIVNPKLPNPWAISPLERLENSFFGKGHTYFLGLDLSLKHDRSGLALCHRETKDNREQKVVIDLLKVWEAPVNGEINFEDIRKFIFMLADRRFRIEMVLLDSFQSADFRQILSKNQIPTETRYSCDKGKQVYDTLKDLINQGKIECVDCKYTKLLIDELLGLSLITNTKIDHTDAGSKDLADSTALAVFASAMSDVSAPAWVKNW